MIPRISLAAAFVLMMAPPMARASTRDAASGAPITCGAQVTPPGTVLAQDEQSSPSMGTTNNDSDDDNSSDSDNDNDSNDNDNDNQNANGNQSDQNASGDDQQIPPTVLGSPDNDQSQSQQAPQPVNPYQ
jgi:hypothetical protein